MSEISSIRGEFLVALPTLRGDYFERSISLMVEHGSSGAFALVANKPHVQTLEEILPHLGSTGIPLLEGGPVEEDRLFFLHSSDRQYEGSTTINTDAVLSTASDLINDIADGKGPEKIIAFAGYAGWGPGQLDDEIARNAWMIAPYAATLLYSTNHSAKPAEAAARLGIDLNLVSPEPGHG